LRLLPVVPLNRRIRIRSWLDYAGHAPPRQHTWPWRTSNSPALTLTAFVTSLWSASVAMRKPAPSDATAAQFRKKTFEMIFGAGGNLICCYALGHGFLNGSDPTLKRAPGGDVCLPGANPRCCLALKLGYRGSNAIGPFSTDYVPSLCATFFDPHHLRVGKRSGPLLQRRPRSYGRVRTKTVLDPRSGRALREQLPPLSPRHGPSSLLRQESAAILKNPLARGLRPRLGCRANVAQSHCQPETRKGWQAAGAIHHGRSDAR
jgi:hypothetical protein